MDEQNKVEPEKNELPTDEQEKLEDVKPAGKYIRIKPFALIMMVIVLILFTSGLTIFALTFGEKKVVEVRTPTHTEFQKLFNAFDELKANYYKDIDTEEAVNGAINGMIEALGDPYSDYMNVEEASNFNESISSSFQGIGAEIQEQGGNIVVVSPIKNSPAEKAGILPNDIIATVDGKSISGMTSSEAVLLIRGEKGTSVTLEIVRGDSEKKVKMKIVRDDIPIETVYSEMLSGKVAHIQITTFSNNTYKELLTALDDMEAKGMKSLIVDVRQNPGGLLDSAVNIASLFVKTGEPVMQIEDKTGEKEVIEAQGGRKVTVPVSLLIDGGSASASEILAGALSESANIPLIGEKSFGKGTVQTASNLKDGSNLKFTTAKWLTPEGNWIHEKGIKPTIKVDYPSYASLPYLDPEKVMKEGSLSEQVKAAEKMLKAVGYTPGKVDGLFDASTKAAVLAFQKDQKLKETGVLKGQSTYALMEELRQKIKKDDPQLIKAKQLMKQKSSSK
ncbi:S41 family peptidase [Viridibacillus arvi]|uniref:lmo1851 family serine protease n=1 Tax=Viridibacillus arvi TaxID=263475 RepID=UPI00187B88D8|nr:S41 family peptidase [Viridibacillus sp. JNUCC-6]QOV11289.1 S41 family peptidase [Viridibacillus sp. JNUCC-6]